MLALPATGLAYLVPVLLPSACSWGWWHITLDHLSALMFLATIFFACNNDTENTSHVAQQDMLGISMLLYWSIMLLRMDFRTRGN